MNVKLLTEHHLKFLSLKGGCTGSSESTLVKMPDCWKSHVAAQLACVEASKLIQEKHQFKLKYCDNPNERNSPIVKVKEIPS